MGIRTSFNPMGVASTLAGGYLPAGYVECEYLESTGTQWINTGVFYGNETAIDITAQLTNSTVDGVLLRSYKNANVDFMISLMYGNKPNKVGINRCGEYLSATIVADTYSQCHIWSEKENPKRFHMNDAEIGQFSRDIDDIPTPIPLFASSINPGVAWRNSQVRIMAFKMWQNGALAIDLRPALDENGRPCMFDLVTRQPFYNSGSGDFLYQLKES